MGLLFFPRGGSAQVARYLAPALGDAGWAVTLVAGSLGEAGGQTQARPVFGGLDPQGPRYNDPLRGVGAGGGARPGPGPVAPPFRGPGGRPPVFLAARRPSLAP